MNKHHSKKTETNVSIIIEKAMENGNANIYLRELRAAFKILESKTI